MYVDYNLKKITNPKGLELAKNEGFAKKWDDFSRFTSTYWLQFFIGDLLDELLKREQTSGLDYNSLKRLCDTKAEIDAFAYVFQGCEKELEHLSAMANKLCKFLETNITSFELTKTALHNELPEVVDLEELTCALRNLKKLVQNIKEIHFQDPEFCDLVDKISEHMTSTANKGL